MKKLLTVLTLGLVLFGTSMTEAAMTFEEASAYQAKYADEILPRTEKMKDAFGEKNKYRYFSFLGRNGVTHNGDYMKADRSTINFIVNYGFKGQDSEPFAAITWQADLKGKPENGYAPDYLAIVFEDGYVANFDLQGWEYKRDYAGFWGERSHTYYGDIKLNSIELYEISKHGNLSAVFMNEDNEIIKHFFYAGEKDIDEKLLFTKGIQHAIKMLEITPATIVALKAEAEEERLANLRKELEAEIEREEMKKAILKERQQKGL